MPNYEQSSHQKNTERMPGSSRRDQRRTTDYTRSQQDQPSATTGRRPRDGENPGSSWSASESSASDWAQLPGTVQQRLFPPDQRPYAPPTIPSGEVSASPANPWTAFGSFPRDWPPPSHSTGTAGSAESGTAMEMDAAIARLQHQQQQTLRQDYDRDLSAARENRSFETPAQVVARYQRQWGQMQQTSPEGQASQPGFVPADAPGSGQAFHAQPFSFATPDAWVFSSEETAPGHLSSALPSWQGETFSEAGWSASQPSGHAPAESFFSALPSERDRGTQADSSLNEGMATTSLTGQRTESQVLNSSLSQRVFTLQRDRTSQLLDEASRAWLDGVFHDYRTELFREMTYTWFTERGGRLWNEFCQMKQWRLEDYDAQLGRLESDRAQWRTRNQWIEDEVQKLENKIKELEKKKGVSPLDKEIQQQIREHKLSQNRLKRSKVEPQKIEQVEKEIATIHQQQVAWEVCYDALSSRPHPQQIQRRLEEPQEDADPTERTEKLTSAGRREQLKTYRQLDRKKAPIAHSTVVRYMDLLREHATQLSGQPSDEKIDFPIGPINRFIGEYYSATGKTLKDINEDSKSAKKSFVAYFHEVKAAFEKQYPSLSAQQTGSQKSEIERISAGQMQKKAEKLKQRKHANKSKYRDIIRNEMGITYNTLRKYIQELVGYSSQSPEKKSTLSPEDIKRFAREYYKAKGIRLFDIRKDAQEAKKSFAEYFHEVKAAFEAEQDAQKRHTAPPTQPEIQHDASPSPSEDEESASE